MSEETPTPRVEKKSLFPSGNIPKGRQTWIMLSVAVIIVLAVVFTGAGTPPSKASEKTAAAVEQAKVIATPSKDEISRFTKQLQAEAEQLQAAQLRATQAQQALEAQSRGLSAPMPGAVPTYSPTGQVYYQPPQATPPPPDPIAEERKKREYTSLYASNLALSYRLPDKREEAPRREETPTTKSPQAPAAAQHDNKPTQPSGYRLSEGTIIETALQNQLDGGFAGPVTCLVTTDVYSHDRQHLLIPKGTRVLGATEEVQDRDQTRLAVIFHRLIMPDGFSVDLDKAAGLDQVGATALKDKVNHHYLSMFATSVALGAIAGLSLSGTQSYYSPDGNAEDMYRQGVARQLGQDSQTILQRQLNRKPDITIRPGHRVKVWLRRDIYLPAYESHPRVPGV